MTFPLPLVCTGGERVSNLPRLCAHVAKNSRRRLAHGVGAVVAAIGGVYLVNEATHSSDLWCSVGCLFYSLALVGVLGSSTLSHLYLPDHLNRRFRAYDQGFIYLLAAGSLSPFALTFLRTPAWMGFYGLSVFLAAGGFASKVLFAHRVDKISLWFYLLLGWGQAIAMIPLASVLPAGAVGWILAAPHATASASSFWCWTSDPFGFIQSGIYSC